jgi:hypothetical protein
MVLTVIFAVGLPLWLVFEEVIRRRAAHAARVEMPKTPRSAEPVGVVLSRSRA